MHIQIGNISEHDLLSYLKKTPITYDVNIVEYTHKVFAHATLFIALEKDSILGLCIVYINDIQSRQAYVTYIYVDENSRNKGIGRTLLETAIEYSRNHKFNTIALEVRKDNFSAKRLYSSLGFMTYQETDRSYYMQKAINQA